MGCIGENTLHIACTLRHTLAITTPRTESVDDSINRRTTPIADERSPTIHSLVWLDALVERSLLHITLVDIRERAVFEENLAVLQRHVGVDIVVRKLANELLLARQIILRALLQAHDVSLGHTLNSNTQRLLIDA